MYERTYASEKAKEKREKRVKIAAKIITIIIIAVPLLTIGFFIGRLTKPAPEYHPDPCGLEVVVCENETQ